MWRPDWYWAYLLNEKEDEGSAEGKEIQEEKARSGVKIEIHREVGDGWKEK